MRVQPASFIDLGISYSVNIIMMISYEKVKEHLPPRNLDIDKDYANQRNGCRLFLDFGARRFPGCHFSRYLGFELVELSIVQTFPGRPSCIMRQPRTGVAEHGLLA